ncbi:MAG TPA: leucyl aminopeptidase, partial [Desulfobacteraceae bacterium]|nr:leucyl aminopeptidase [Desulfobacteraceae bacterium]
EDDAAVVDNAMGGAISELIQSGEITGKLNETTILHTLGKLPAGRIVIVGLGKKKAFNADKLRGAIAETCRHLRDRAVKSIVCSTGGHGIAGINTLNAAQAITEGALLGLYTFRRYITADEKRHGSIDSLIITGAPTQASEREQGASIGSVNAEASNWARDLVNEPGNRMTPARMAEAAAELSANCGLEIQVLEKKDMASLAMGALLGVAQGSLQPPKFIIIKYFGRDSNKIDVALVGKGITFDSGGISIKPSEKMSDMKGDMAGGAAVMAAIGAVSKLEIEINVAALVPATENMPGGGALKPGDILTAMNGKTIEVLNTDAEGRLILADTLSYAAGMQPGVIVDVATLTGACHVALGGVCSGAFSNDRRLAAMISAAGEETGEHMWRMPMFDEYKELLKSENADIKNIGNRWGGAITAAKFLEFFIGKTRWIHLDIAGTSDTEKEKGYLVKGATGIPVRTLISFVKAMSR